LLQVEYSPIAEAEKLDLSDNHLYQSLLGNLYTDVDNKKALQHFETALALAKTSAEKTVIESNIARLLK
jgi:predicted RNA polymerase sigma factor